MPLGYLHMSRGRIKGGPAGFEGRVGWDSLAEKRINGREALLHKKWDRNTDSSEVYGLHQASQADCCTLAEGSLAVSRCNPTSSAEHKL